MDPEEIRINELEFLELCTRLSAYNSSPSFFESFFVAIKRFIDYDAAIIIGLAKEIFGPKYRPNKQELLKIMQLYNIPKKELARMFGKGEATIYRWCEEEIMMYPRCTEIQQKELHKFMTEYKKIFNADMHYLM